MEKKTMTSNALSNHFSRDFMAPRKAEEWNKCIHGLIKQMHQDLSILFVDVEESLDSQSAAIHESSDSAEVPDDLPFPAVVEAFVKHCDSLCLLLRTPTKWPVKLPLNSAVRVLTRCLRVTSADLKSKPSLSELSDALPNLHGSALLVMNQLINCCGSNVLPLSRILADASFRCLSGAKQAKEEFKSKTRGKAFKVLCLMVERFGWGRYFQSLSFLLMQEIISDISAQGATKANSSVTTTKPKFEVESIAQRKSKKRKRGKKLKADSYSDLPVYAVDDPGSIQSELYNVEATEAALELSHLVIQRADFSQLKTLVRSLLQICKNLQTEGVSVSSPYSLESCREKLYLAVFSCATVRLGFNCDRKDTIGHYQVTNLAMSLLTRAVHSDSSPAIQDRCKKFLELLRTTGNLNRPIVRRVLPDEQISTKDITEVEREAERLGEENKSLWKQLVDSQLEAETQRRQLEQLQASLKRTEMNLSDLRNTSENNNDDDKDIVKFDEDPESAEVETEESNEDDETNMEERTEISTKPAPDEESKSNLDNVINASSVNPSKESISEEIGSSATKTPTKDKKKRTLDEKSTETNIKKKPKTGGPETTESEDVDAMLLDFVDAGPDQA